MPQLPEEVSVRFGNDEIGDQKVSFLSQGITVKLFGSEMVLVSRINDRNPGRCVYKYRLIHFGTLLPDSGRD